MDSKGCEFRFVDSLGHKLTGTKRSLHAMRRLRTLARIAVRLQHAGWPVWFTVVGLAFLPPGNEWYDEENGPDEYLVAELLVELGIEEEFKVDPSRTVAEMPTCWLSQI